MIKKLIRGQRIRGYIAGSFVIAIILFGVGLALWQAFA